jgi:hypothetical protein
MASFIFAFTWGLKLRQKYLFHCPRANSGGTRSFNQKLGTDPLTIEKNTWEFLDCAFLETDFANAVFTNCMEHKRKICQPFALCKGAETICHP